MDFFSKLLPPYMLTRKNMTSMVVFSAIFALLFINAYRPFNVDQLYPEESEITILAISSLLILVGFVVIAISRFIMYRYALKKSVSYLAFCIWTACEIVVLAVVYTFMAHFYLPNPDQVLFRVWLNSLRNTTLVMAIPYLIFILYLSLQDYSERLKRVDELQQASREVLLPSVLSFYDYKGDMKFSVKRENLLYIESDDNYVNIWYTNKGKVEKFILRTTLKVLEGYSFGGGILRCHRSYIVNFDNVCVIKREKDGYVYAEFAIEGVRNIPVSASYSDVVTNAFLK